jgi:acyl-CoA synthetase (AMP-forming)/AMP-acid ligase II
MTSPTKPFRSPFPDVSIPNVPLTEFVLGAASTRGDKPALVCAATNRTLTYRQLVDDVRRLAAGLSRRGIAKGDVVGVWAPNSPDYAVVFHAVISLGAILMTANPAYTAEELSFQLRDARPKLLFTVAALVDRARDASALASQPLEIVTLDDGGEVPTLSSIAVDASPPRVAIDPDRDIAVMPYSSGTTGLPKGVMLTHRNLVANITQFDSLEVQSMGTLLGVLPCFHIYGMVVIMSFGLMRGETIVTLPRFDLETVLRTLQDWRIAMAHLVPPVIVALAKHPIVDKYDLSHLKWIFSGAAPLGVELTEAVEKRLSVRIRQGYGLTETSPVTHYSLPDREKAGKVGQLVPSTELRIVDPASGEDMGVGERGEVWIRGPQVMKGYLNNPDATARTIDGDGWLKTGDVGVIDDEGYLEVVDRLKELIKVKGFQVAPAELEALLLKHPAVADVAVIPVPDEECGEVPKAFIVARGPLGAEEVMSFVAGRVAHYKKVRHVAFVEQIPKSPSGKILRRVLIAGERAG